MDNLRSSQPQGPRHLLDILNNESESELAPLVAQLKKETDDLPKESTVAKGPAILTLAEEDALPTHCSFVTFRLNKNGYDDLMAFLTNHAEIMILLKQYVYRA